MLLGDRCGDPKLVRISDVEGKFSDVEGFQFIGWVKWAWKFS